MSKENPTLGESRVRMSFNPSGNSEVDVAKRHGADFIDFCETLKDPDLRSERNRCLAIAQTKIEEATIFAVKGATA